jgi:hypothetical protein
MYAIMEKASGENNKQYIFFSIYMTQDNKRQTK